jgi:hypothetical protein
VSSDGVAGPEVSGLSKEAFVSFGRSRHNHGRKHDGWILSNPRPRTKYDVPTPPTVPHEFGVMDPSNIDANRVTAQNATQKKNGRAQIRSGWNWFAALLMLLSWQRKQKNRRNGKLGEKVFSLAKPSLYGLKLKLAFLMHSMPTRSQPNSPGEQFWKPPSKAS